MKTQSHHKLLTTLPIKLALAIAVFQIVSLAPAQQSQPPRAEARQLYRVSGVSNGLALQPYSKEFDAARANGTKPTGRITPVDRLSFVALRAVRQGDQVALPLSDTDAITGTANLVQDDGKTLYVAGELSGKKAGSFCI